VDDTKPSKSARKREHQARQKLGEELITLRDAELESLELDEDLLEAVMEARSIKARGALRRQKQYIGKIMRHIDPEPIRAALERLRRK
jgi:ribosome-associated protein